MTSRAIEIRDATIVLLNTDRPTEIPEATKRWLFPGAPFEGSRIAVLLDDEPGRYPRDNASSAITLRNRMVWVQIAVISETGEDLDDQVEDIREWVTSVLGSTNLGGLVLNLHDRGILSNPPPRRYMLDRYHLVVHCGWIAEYQTKRDDLSQEA